MNTKIILASKSPRRQELMEMLPWAFEIEALDVDEQMDENRSVDENLMVLAHRKAIEIAHKYPDAIVIGGDTIVLADGRILGKPENLDDAKAMLRTISKEPHHVYTGICILCENRKLDIRFVEKTEVVMTPLTEQEIESYIADGEPFGKAGAYAIQGAGGVFVEKINGDFFNVVGLPVNRLYRELKKIL